MRSYENSGYNPFNDNYRGQSRSSARNYYSDENDLTNRRMRTAHGNDTFGSRVGDFGAGRDVNETSGYGGTSTYGRSAGRSDYGSSNTRYDNNYGYDRDNDRDTWDRTGDEVKSWFSDDDAERRRRMDDMRDDDYDRSNRGTYRGSSNYAGSYGDSDYGSRSDSYGGSNYGRSTDYNSGYGSSDYRSDNYGGSNRNSSGSSWDRDSNRGWSSDNDNWNRNNDNWGRDRDRDNDRGFFDRAGDEVKSWFGDDDAERRRRMDEMRDRDYDNDSNYRRRTSYGNTYSGPPYSYGSSSRRDYEW